MQDVTRAKISTFGDAIWQTILNIKFLCLPRCVPELL